MEKLFGIPMDSIMVVMLVVFGIVTGIVGAVALRNRVMLKIGLRNIPRRRSQTILIVSGLMLATMIITSAFGTGDTMTYSIRMAVVDDLGKVDEVIQAAQSNNGESSNAREVRYFSVSEFDHLSSQLADYELIDGMIPAIAENAPLVDVTSRQNKSRILALGLPADYHSVLSLTDTDGKAVDLAALQANEVYVAEEVAKSLNAKPGDELHLFASQQPAIFTLRSVIVGKGLPGDGAVLVMPLDRAQTLLAVEGKINQIFVSNRGGLYDGAGLSKDVTKKLRSLVMDGQVVSDIRTILAAPDVRAKLVEQVDTLDDGQRTVLRDKLASLLTEIEKASVTDDLKSLLGDSNVNSQLRTIAKELPDDKTGARLSLLLGSTSSLAVDDVKARGIDTAESIGNAFTSIFVAFGLFSIAAGVLLIFLIFVMLAAERKPEMGMARAVGTKRRHLIEIFAFEGFAYDLMAAVVGVIAGVAIGFIMVGVIASAIGQEEGLAIQRHFELRSLVVAYCLGMLLTFFTVTISAWRVSRINIVAAIRDLPDMQRARAGLLADFVRPFQVIASAFRNLFRFRIRRAIGDLLWRGPRATLAFWWSLFKLGPLTVIVGALFVVLGLQMEQSFPFNLGVSLAILGFGLTLRWFLSVFGLRSEVKDRIGFSVAGILIVVWWSLPFHTATSLGIPELKSGIEMFFLSGIMMVLGAVLAVIYNSSVVIGLLTATVGRIGRLAPVVKTAVAYPMNFKFRTGLTISMFALVVFTMIVMSIIIEANVVIFEDREVLTGGYSLQATVSHNNPIADIGAETAKSDKLSAADFEAFGSQSFLPVKVRQIDNGSSTWEDYWVSAVDNAFLDSNSFRLSTKAKGYETERDVWRTLKEKPGYAVVDSAIVPQKNATSIVIGGPTFKLSGIYMEDTTMDPIEIEIRDSFSGHVTRLTVIGVLDYRSFVRGIHTSYATVARGFSYEPPLTTHFFKLSSQANTTEVARALGSTFLQNGMEVQVMEEVIDKSLAQNQALNGLLQGFMALGLLIGIAALGVISTRAVVERRQQIGMLRAIGYKPRMVQLSFLMESSFIAMLGIVLGVSLGLVLSYNLVEFLGESLQGLRFEAPWLQIVLIVGISYAAALLTTYLPARQASKVYPAEALRYE